MKTLTHEAVALRAQQIWQDSGCIEGRDLDNWIEAERRLISDEPAAELSAALHQGSEHIPGESPGDHARDEVAAEQKHEARAAKVPHKYAPHAKPPESGKPLWSQPHSR
jgi:hypothetical protein